MFLNVLLLSSFLCVNVRLIILYKYYIHCIIRIDVDTFEKTITEKSQCKSSLSLSMELSQEGSTLSGGPGGVLPHRLLNLLLLKRRYCLLMGYTYFLPPASTHTHTLTHTPLSDIRIHMHTGTSVCAHRTLFTARSYLSCSLSCPSCFQADASSYMII